MQKNFKNFSDVRAICPFYLGLDAEGHVLRCESLIEHSALTVTFQSKVRCANYMRQYCHSFTYEKCPLYQALETKYQ